MLEIDRRQGRQLGRSGHRAADNPVAVAEDDVGYPNSSSSVAREVPLSRTLITIRFLPASSPNLGRGQANGIHQLKSVGGAPNWDAESLPTPTIECKQLLTECLGIAVLDQRGLDSQWRPLGIDRRPARPKSSARPAHPVVSRLRRSIGTAPGDVGSAHRRPVAVVDDIDVGPWLPVRQGLPHQLALVLRIDVHRDDRRLAWRALARAAGSGHPTAGSGGSPWSGRTARRHRRPCAARRLPDRPRPRPCAPDPSARSGSATISRSVKPALINSRSMIIPAVRL